MKEIGAAKRCFGYVRILLVSFVFSPLMAIAAEPEQGTDPETNEILVNPNVPEQTPIDSFDENYRFVSSSVSDFAQFVDSFFVDTRVDEEYFASRLRLGVGGLFATKDAFEFRKRFGGNLPLPGLKDSFSVAVDSFTDATNFDTRDGTLQEGDNGVATLRYMPLSGEMRRNVLVSAGMRFEPEPNPLLRLRGRYDFDLSDNWVVRPMQLFFWELDLGLGETTRLDFDRRIGEHMLARMRVQATYTEESRGFDHETALSLQDQLSESSAYILRFSFLGETEPSTRMNQYRASWRYRQRLWRPWFFIEIEPGVNFDRENDFDVDPNIGLIFEVIFDNRFLRDVEFRPLW